jgi:hypothetical protein
LCFLEVKERFLCPNVPLVVPAFPNKIVYVLIVGWN